ncbi:hypothetical protein BH09MYX1_BH09MYX1_10510 [soil metagenome]
MVFDAAAGAATIVIDYRAPFAKLRGLYRVSVGVGVPKDMRALSNGVEAKTEPDGPNLVRHVFAPTAPLPAYLIGLAVGSSRRASCPAPKLRFV